jgi:DegV family protein with EDD domain
VPATITFNSETYLEGVNLSREEFYGRLIKYAGLPKTAAPGPGAFAGAFAQLVEENQRAGVPLDGIISLHPPAALSGLYNSAFSASQMIESAHVTVVDSGQLSMGMGLMTAAAARAAIAGQSVDEILSLISKLKPRTQIVAGLETLEWAARSGRVNRLVAAVGNLLAVKPILHVHDGQITLAERVRTHGRQVERVLETARSWAPYSDVAVLHARAPELAEEVATAISDLFPRQKIVLAEIGCILGSYTGPGVYGVAGIRE